MSEDKHISDWKFSRDHNAEPPILSIERAGEQITAVTIDLSSFDVQIQGSVLTATPRKR